MTAQRLGRWVASAVLGFLAGLLGCGVYALVHATTHALAGRRWWEVAAVLTVALAVSLTALRCWPGGPHTAGMADAYLTGYPAGAVPLPPAPARVVAFAGGTAGGLPLGLEAPMLYVGGVLASTAAAWSRRRGRAVGTVLGSTDVFAGAAAGAVTAVLGVPLAGALFAVEAPFRRGASWRELPAALLGAAGGWAATVVTGQRHVLVAVAADLSLTARGVAAVALAVAGGVAAARVMGALVRRAKAVAWRPWVRVAAGGATLAVLAAAAAAATDGEVGVLLGGGLGAAAWSLGGHGLVERAVVLGVRVVATPVALAGGGAGGVFVPLLGAGAVAGGLAAAVADAPPAVPVVVGAAVCLACGYRVPVTAAVLGAAVVAEPVGAVVAVVAVSVGWWAAPAVGVTEAQAPAAPSLRWRRDQPPTRWA